MQKHRKHLDQFIIILQLYNSEITVGHNHGCFIILAGFKQSGHIEVAYLVIKIIK